MQIVIDIPKGFYEYVKEHKDIFTYGLINGEKIGDIIANGTPLPEKHGRLIDTDKLCNDLIKRWKTADKKKEIVILSVMADIVTPIIVSQPTILEATKENNDANSN